MATTIAVTKIDIEVDGVLITHTLIRGRGRGIRIDIEGVVVMRTINGKARLDVGQGQGLRIVERDETVNGIGIVGRVAQSANTYAQGLRPPREVTANDTGKKNKPRQTK